jgi:hypothetical protein
VHVPGQLPETSRRSLAPRPLGAAGLVTWKPMIELGQKHNSTVADSVPLNRTPLTQATYGTVRAPPLSSVGALPAALQSYKR